MRSIEDNIGKLGLEGLMDRANIAFTNGYHFKGCINSEYLQQSINAICKSLYKFNFQVNFISQDNYSWDRVAQHNYPLTVIYSEKLDEEFTHWCRDSIVKFEKNAQPPMLFALITKSNSDEDEFIIVQTSCHTYVDARSSEVIFNKIIEYYNALCKQNSANCDDIVLSVAKLQTVDADVVIQERFDMNSNVDHDKNVREITSYSVSDVGQHAIPMTVLDNKLNNYKEDKHPPVVQYYDVEAMVTASRQQYPHLTKNSVICAAIVKAMHEINVQDKGVEADHTISFKMLSDILTPDMRQKYTGNYIAFVPVTVNGNKSLTEIANDINNRIVEFKTTSIDVSVFSLTEDAVEAAAVGTADEPLSFIVTNWNNFTFTSTEDYLHNCSSIRHQSGVNIEPKDSLGAALVNRPVFVINFSPNNELCISQFPSLDSKQVNQTFANGFDNVFSNNGK